MENTSTAFITAAEMVMPSLTSGFTLFPRVSISNAATSETATARKGLILIIVIIKAPPLPQF